MSRRTRQRRSRPRRDTGSGVSSPSRGRTETKWDAVGKRIDVSYDVIGHPQQASKPVEEGKHYKTLAYTDWADTFVPTVVQWNHGAVDSFTDPAKSRENQRKALAQERRRYLKRAVTEMKKAAKEEKLKYGKPGPMTLRDLSYYQFELKKEREKVREPRMSQRIKMPAQIKVRGKFYVEHTGAYTIAEAEQKAEDIRRRGYKAAIRRGNYQGQPVYTIYARKEGAS